MSKMKIKLDQKAVGNLLLKSREIDNLLKELGEGVANKYGDMAEVKLRTKLGNRHRVYVNVDYSKGSEDNKLLKALT